MNTLNSAKKTFLPFMMLFFLTGCFLQPAEELYHLPMQSMEYDQLMGSINSVRSTLELTNPGVEYANILSGENTATIQLQTLSLGFVSQELDTALTFFRVPSAADAPMKIFVFNLNEEGNYVPLCIIEGQGTSILSVEYADINGSGKKEIIINWQNNQLGIYSLDDLPPFSMDPAQALLSQIPEATELLTTSHNAYSLIDMNRDKLFDLAVLRLDTGGVNSFVELYSWQDMSLQTHSIAPLSEGITSLSNLRSNSVTGGLPALYVSSNLLDSSRVTDILILKDNRLSNITLDSETNISASTVRDYRDIGPTDINNDNVLEIPEPIALPTYTEDETLTIAPSFWLIDWEQYNSHGTSSYVFSTYHNIADGWYLVIPAHWQDQITISRDDSIAGQRTVIFSKWNGSNTPPTPFLAIYKLTGANRDTRADLANRFLLGGDSATIYAASFFEGAWDCGMDEQDLIQSFYQIISSWS